MTQLKKIAPFAAMAMGVVLAFTTSAFKQAHHPKGVDDTYTFEYAPPGGTDYSADAVQDLANWHYNAAPAPCLGNTKACSIELPGGMGYVDGEGTTNPTLDSTFNITASEADGVAKVTSTSADEDGAVISNQAN
ncbi:hypothetical protein A9P82_05835 [Arachidicoccus ginsenosidimutans]|uniref:hypothetical protein n=1 Tax=Arachidicoccus sp. BS20 TaxID=1850526 RepID=UPI0007F084E7|nr:hypothetical protein [Arachidicoccus sp. BS20]ANI88851.1 hypothetical protein A9P82_05835 [Arachidicoccus sp. BS20]